MALTTEQQEAADKRAADAARKEYENDPNRLEPDGVQDRMNAAVKALHAPRK